MTLAGGHSRNIKVFVLPCKAIEKASKNKAMIDAIGDPIVRGPWHNASLAVDPKSHSLSCTFPVSGLQDTGIFQFRAVRNEGDTWFSFLLAPDWDILIMKAILHVPGNEEKQQTFRISLADDLPGPACKTCIDHQSPKAEESQKKNESQAS
ncbi:unnamed protein product [Ilex paraguariensis]|uniref:Uncharacterized protein n=1 Tax=Ilex paraguariensis TaxID=185542 RepID=A0ABC8QMF6_9AQUA